LDPFGDHGACGDQRFGTDIGAVHHDGAHTDQHMIGDGGAVHNGAVPHRYPVPEYQWQVGIDVECAIILHISVSADGDRFIIGTEDRIIPDAGSVSEDDASGQSCV